ncbi:MAG: hypothetical protein JRI77_13655, partial [Deltaproteobacteria bacterium]|nr:hypothetical protein [Deltaproteobacteria bacterium]
MKKDVILNAIDESYKDELDPLLSKNEVGKPELDKLEAMAGQVWENYVAIGSLRHKHQNLKKELESKALELLELHSKIKEKVGKSLSKIKPKSKGQYYALKRAIAENYVVAVQELFKVLQG